MSESIRGAIPSILSPSRRLQQEALLCSIAAAGFPECCLLARLHQGRLSCPPKSPSGGGMPGSCRPCMLQRLKASESPEDTTHLGPGPACVTLQRACSRGGDCWSPGPTWEGMCALGVLCTPQKVAGSCQLSAFKQQEQLRWQPGLICRTGMLCLGINRCRRIDCCHTAARCSPKFWLARLQQADSAASLHGSACSVQVPRESCRAVSLRSCMQRTGAER